MAIRNIRQEGDEILKKKSREVEVIDEKTKELINDMIETMHKYDGVGLAAVQVGILKRIIVIDIYDEKTPIVKLINPVILKQKGEREVEEGCLSFPNKYAKVKRPNEVVVETFIAGKSVTTPVSKSYNLTDAAILLLLYSPFTLYNNVVP